MATKTRAQLKAFIDANLNTNGANQITGAQLNTLLNDVVDGVLNLEDDSTSLALDIYRAASVAVVEGVVEQVTFSTPLSTASYQITLSDPEGVGFENITDILTTGFKFTPLGTGNITYTAIINN